VFSDKISNFLPFIKKIFYEHEVSQMNLDINKTQINILMFVCENSGKFMSEISLLTGLEKSSFTRSVDHLVKNKFVKKNYSENDRRKISLSLTGKGKRVSELVKNDFNNYLESLISDFSGEERKEFMTSLDVVSKYISKILKKNDRGKSGQS